MPSESGSANFAECQTCAACVSNKIITPPSTAEVHCDLKDCCTSAGIYRQNALHLHKLHYPSRCKHGRFGDRCRVLGSLAFSRAAGCPIWMSDVACALTDISVTFWRIFASTRTGIIIILCQNESSKLWLIALDVMKTWIQGCLKSTKYAQSNGN